MATEVKNESKWFKTAAGEKYGKCGLMFGAEPVEVPAAKLATKRPGFGQDENTTIGQRLAEDQRLVEVPPPAKPDAKKAGDGGKDDGKGSGEK